MSAVVLKDVNIVAIIGRLIINAIKIKRSQRRVSKLFFEAPFSLTIMIALF